MYSTIYSRVIGVVAMAAFIVACNNQNTQQSQSTPRSVKSADVVMVSTEEESTLYPARVVAAQSSNLAFRVAGEVESIEVSIGAFVKQGEVVATLDSRDYQTQLTATEAEYEGVKAHADRVIELHKSGTVSPNDYDKAVAALQQIEAKLRAHRDAFGDTQLKAPYDGYIQEINYERGEVAAAGMPILTMIADRMPEVEINIPTADYLRRGDLLSATAHINSFNDGKELGLELIGITPKANLNRLYTAKFRVTQEPAPTAGMVAMVTLNFKTKESSTLAQIPLSSIANNQVWIINDGSVKRREVDVVRIMSNETALVKGLSAGEQVVSGGANRLKDGDRVKVLKAVSKSNVGGLL